MEDLRPLYNVNIEYLNDVSNMRILTVYAFKNTKILGNVIDAAWEASPPIAANIHRVITTRI